MYRHRVTTVSRCDVFGGFQRFAHLLAESRLRITTAAWSATVVCFVRTYVDDIQIRVKRIKKGIEKRAVEVCFFEGKKIVVVMSFRETTRTR